MRNRTRSIFHFALSIIFIFSQVTVQSASAAATDHPKVETALPDGQGAQAQFSEARPGPEPAEEGSVIVPAARFKSTKSALEIAAELKLLGYTLPSYPVYSEQNGLSIEPLAAYNLVVDSNVLSPSSYGPSAATFAAKYCNTGSSTLTNVWAYIGNYDADYDNAVGGPEPVIPGFFPKRSETAPAYDPDNPSDPDDFADTYGASSTNPLVGATSTDYGATNTPFALDLASGTQPEAVDGSRHVGTLTPGECKTQYWLITYPRKAWSASGWRDVTGGVKPDDDLWLPYFFWGTSTGTTTATSYRWNVVTMRNEISAMANKIWPNGDSKVPDKYLEAIAQIVGWDTITPSGTSDVYPGDTIISQGIWYDLGNVGAGFDNNGDFVPDRNAWLQPIGDAGAYDPGCFRLVRTYGLVIVKLNDGTEQLIPFVDQMYFENIPDNNTGAVGLVFYEYAALDGICTANLTPYQEVASGYDNEKFNADYGAGIPPLQSQESNMTLDKTGPNTVGLTGTINYSLTFTLPDIDADPGNTTSLIVGQPSYGMPLTYSDAVPVGLQYVANSASTSIHMSSNYSAGDIPVTIWNSKDGGATWTMGDPGTYTSSSAANQLVLQWRLQNGVSTPASGAAYTGTAVFQAVVPGTYSSVKIENEACLQIGSGPGFTCDPHVTVVTGNSSVTGLVWKDDAVTTGVLGNAIPDGTEAGIPAVTVNLYWDNNGDGDYADAGDFLYATANSMNYAIIDGYVDVDGGGVGANDDAALSGISIIDGGLDLDGNNAVNTLDDGYFGGYTVIDGRIDRDRSGTITTADDGTLVGVYNFGRLPATTSMSARYIVVVDPRDGDIPIGYAPTTPTAYTGINLAANTAYGDATDGTEPSDFGFAPVLTLDKNVTNGSSFGVGDTIEYQIAVRNNLPGPGDGSSGYCSYVLWTKEAYFDEANTPKGGNSSNAQWIDVAKMLNAPDSSSAFTYIKDNSDKLGLSGYNIGNMAGTITSVQFVAKVSEKVNLATNDEFEVHVYYNNTEISAANYIYDGAGGYTAPATQGYFTGGTGSAYSIVETINPVTVKGVGQSWAWSDFAGDATTTTSSLDSKLEFQVIGDKGAGDGDLYMDAFGIKITTDQQCSGAAATLNPVPLTDTYNDAYFDFVSANPPISNTTLPPTGTLTWNNVGPLYPGQTRYITVYMRAAAVGSTTNTDNTATSTNAKFSNGLPANSPVSDTATVTITANSNTRSLTGRVFDDNNNPPNGWQTPLWTAGGSGYDTGDTGIPYIPVDLYGCVDTAGTLITAEGNNKSCILNNGLWKLVRSASTDLNGDYIFNNLAAGYYRVQVHSSLIVGTLTADVNQPAVGMCSGIACDSWSNGEYDLLDATNFAGDVDEFTAVTRINFGYNVPAGVYDIGDLVFYDWDGDGIKDIEDEPMQNVTLRLLAADGTYLTQTNTSGVYGFADRSPAYYTVEVDTNTLPSGVVQTKDPDSTMDNKSSFALTADKWDVDFGYRPFGSGTIGDTVFKDINGNGTQDGTDETGIAGAVVELQVDKDNNGTYVTIKTATTDSNGHYLFTGLPAGTYRVSINLSSNAGPIPDDTFGNNYFPSNGTNTGTVVNMDKTLTSATSSDLTADFGFAPPASIGDTVYWDSNGNGTQDIGEPGINGVTVNLYTFTDSNNNNRYDPGETLSAVTTVATATLNGQAGKYIFTGLDTDKNGVNYVVSVDTSSAPISGKILNGDPSADGVPTNCASINLASANCDARDGMKLFPGSNYTGADFGFLSPGSFGDTLWIDTNNNGKLDPGEVGIPNITITATTTNNVTVNGVNYPGGTSLTSTSDANGNYSFQNILAVGGNATWTVSVNTADTDFPAGLLQAYDPDGTLSNSTTVIISTTGVVSSVGGCSTTPNGCDGETDALNLDVDFGYYYLGTLDITGTVCLESTGVNGYCGTGIEAAGTTTGEFAYDDVTLYLLRWTDSNNNGVRDNGETAQIASTQTDTNGNYMFDNVPQAGVTSIYYIVAVGAPQDGLEITTDGIGDVPAEAVDAYPSSAYPPELASAFLGVTSNADGDTLSAFEVIKADPGVTLIDGVDFAYATNGEFDFGDLPQGAISGTTYKYSTLLEGTPDGPRHLVPATPNLYLGTGIDVDPNGFATSTTANGDTEENGVTIGADKNWGDGAGQLNFDITGSGWLVGWIDFNADGDFADAHEVVINRAVSGDLNNFSITTPYNGTTVLPPTGGYIYARFRLFPSEPVLSALAYVGSATGGEVEDYRFPIDGSGITTPVTVAYFYAHRHGSTVDFEWSTATETGNVGFNLYAEGEAGLVQINKELIPSNVVDSHDKQDYTFSLDVGGSLFYIEDVSVLNETRLHGPFQIGQKYGGLEQSDKIDQAAIRSEHNKKTTESQATLRKGMKVPAEAKQNASWLSLFSTFQLTTTLNLEVRETGIYRVSYEMLKDAGLDLKDVPSTKITITNRGEEIPVYIEGEGKFGPGSFIEFYGEALDTLYTDANIYTVQVSSARASRIKESNAKPANKVLPLPSYTETLTVNNQRAFSNSAPNEDAWYDTSMLVYTTPKTWEFPFEVRDLASVSSEASMTLVLWGGTDSIDYDPDHHVKVSINNTPVADQSFNGMVEQVLAIQVPIGTLHEGKNTLQLTLPGDTGVQWDMINLDKFSLNYQRLYRAQAGRLTFTAAGQTFAVTNLPSQNVVVYRLDEKGDLERLKNTLTQAAGAAFTATFAGTKDKASTYFVTTVDAIYTPTLEPTRVDADLKQPAQYLIISHPDFIDGLQLLIQARQAQGLTVNVVNVNDLYAQYSHGIFDPQAIKDYIAFAAQNLGTQYVLLVGGDTYDYRNYLGVNSISFIPSLYVETSKVVKFVPADPLYADLDGNNVPDMAIGRFPVRTTAELDLMVKKTLAYQAKNYGGTATFISDKSDGVLDFKSMSNNISAGLPVGWTVESLHMDDIGVSAARTQLLAAMNRGTALITFTGHSGPQKWTFSGLFGFRDPASLTNAGKPFVVVQWGCWNTYHVDPVYKYMVQSFLFPGDKGAAAVLGASTLTDSVSEEKLGVLLTPRLTTRGMPIGKALLDAKFELAKTDPELLDVLLGWTLMGDPALVIQP